MSDPYMREIVGTIDYQSPEGSKDGYGKPKVFNWKNSNKLLKKGFNGVKTGNTPAAGPCLCTSYQRDKLHVIVVVLDSKNMENRWDDSVKLTFWGINRLEAIYEALVGKPIRYKEVTPSAQETASSSKSMADRDSAQMKAPPEESKEEEDE